MSGKLSPRRKRVGERAVSDLRTLIILAQCLMIITNTARQRRSAGLWEASGQMLVRRYRRKA